MPTPSATSTRCRLATAKKAGRIAYFRLDGEPVVATLIQVAAEQFTYVDCLTGEEHTVLIERIDRFGWERLLLHTEIPEYLNVRRQMGI